MLPWEVVTELAFSLNNKLRPLHKLKLKRSVCFDQSACQIGKHRWKPIPPHLSKFFYSSQNYFCHFWYVQTGRTTQMFFVQRLSESVRQFIPICMITASRPSLSFRQVIHNIVGFIYLWKWWHVDIQTWVTFITFMFLVVSFSKHIRHIRRACCRQCDSIQFRLVLCWKWRGNVSGPTQ